MTIEAIWADFVPGTLDEREVHKDRLATRADIEGLVHRLGRPDTSEAQLIHSSRPVEVDSITGQTVPDHQVIVVVRGGFGYVEYAGEDEFCQSVGDPASPEHHTSTSGYFHPGTGVSCPPWST
ncbi:hypothetical protein ACWEFJ_15310 [Actinosynnema sp. NPDC004786]